MMTRFLIVELLFFMSSTTFAFTPLASRRTTATTTILSSSSSTSTTSNDIEEIFYKAVQCASSGNSKSSKPIDIELYDQLATSLEEYAGCKYEENSTKDICEKEIQDRLDVADILRLKIELQLRLDYLEQANLFADDVRKEHDVLERQKFKQELLANRAKAAEGQSGSDLGLW